MINEAFDRFVDDYTECVLAIIDRLHSDEHLDPVVIHASLTRRLSEARQSHHHDDDWEAAMYALVALTDELMLEMPWSGRVWWNDHVLEASMFGSRVCSERFYQLANQAARDPSGGVLRVFHDCVLLGFRGIYSNPDLGESTTKELGIPTTLENWLAQTQQRLADDATGSEPARLHRQLSGAAPNADRRSIVLWSVAAGTMLIANIVVFVFSQRA